MSKKKSKEKAKPLPMPGLGGVEEAQRAFEKYHGAKPGEDFKPFLKKRNTDKKG